MSQTYKNHSVEKRNAGFFKTVSPQSTKPAQPLMAARVLCFKVRRRLFGLGGGFCREFGFDGFHVHVGDDRLERQLLDACLAVVGNGAVAQFFPFQSGNSHFIAEFKYV